MIGTISNVSVFTTKSRLRITTLSIKDSTGLVKAKWFGPQYIESRFKEGEDVALSGKPEVKKTGSIEFKNPTIEKFADIDELSETGSLIPIYPKVDGVSSGVIRKAIKDALSIIDTPKEEFEPGIEDMLTREVIDKNSIFSRTESFKSIHFPKTIEEFQKARERLALDEFIYLRSIFENLKSEFKNKNKGPKYIFENSLIDTFVADLPFQLTESQTKAYKEILEDLKNDYPMKRLLQGDVGSGKTVVAAISIYAVINSGYQVALMAPTEVLAEQHLNSLNAFLKNSDVEINFLTSSVKDRSEVMNNISDGKPGLYIGTHALIQDKVFFSNLGLVIIDEQQRFGVDQRKKLISDSEITPDQLVMTATPIPRTTALSIYGDLEISSINELPPGRKPIVSHLFSGLKKDNEKVFEKCSKHLDDNSQIFVVGNGGSASNASHFATDLSKGGSDAVGKRFKCMSLNDNVSWMTALANDYDYDEIFVGQLRNLANPQDLLIALSVSGDSPNVVKAMNWAKENGLSTFALTGARRGKITEIADDCLVINSDHYGRVEDAQMMICHILCYAFMENPEMASPRSD